MVSMTPLDLFPCNQTWKPEKNAKTHDFVLCCVPDHFRLSRPSMPRAANWPQWFCASEVKTLRWKALARCQPLPWLECKRGGWDSKMTIGTIGHWPCMKSLGMSGENPRGCFCMKRTLTLHFCSIFFAMGSKSQAHIFQSFPMKHPRHRVSFPPMFGGSLNFWSQEYVNIPPYLLLNINGTSIHLKNHTEGLVRHILLTTNIDRLSSKEGWFCVILSVKTIVEGMIDMENQLGNPMINLHGGFSISFLWKVSGWQMVVLYVIISIFHIAVFPSIHWLWTGGTNATFMIFHHINHRSLRFFGGVFPHIAPIFKWSYHYGQVSHDISPISSRSICRNHIQWPPRWSCWGAWAQASSGRCCPDGCWGRRFLRGPFLKRFLGSCCFVGFWIGFLRNSFRYFSGGVFFWMCFFVEFVTEHVRSFLKMGSGCHNSGPLDPSRSGGSGGLAQAHFADLQSPGEGISRRQARQLRIWVNFYDLEMVWNWDMTNISGCSIFQGLEFWFTQLLPGQMASPTDLPGWSFWDIQA